jgi:hypothetical protein
MFDRPLDDPLAEKQMAAQNSLSQLSERFVSTMYCA